MKQRVYYYEDDNIKNKQITSRYKFSLPLLKGKTVADIGCGARMGHWIASSRASRVIGLDISQEAILYCSKRWGKNNIIYLVADAKRLPFKNGVFDVVLSFELIEHLDDYEGYLVETYRILKKDGMFIISTPNRIVVSPRGVFSNPDHIREFNLEEFKNILFGHFSNITLYGQKPSLKVIKTEDFLNDVNKKLGRVPKLLKQILPPRLKKKIRDTYISFFIRLKALPDPKKITEEDFIFEKEDVEKARNFLAICRK